MSNIVNLTKIRAYKRLAEEEFLKVYSVHIDSLTGEWIDKPVYIKQAVTESYWLNQEDTSTEKHIISKLKDSEEDIALLLLYNN